MAPEITRSSVENTPLPNVMESVQAVLTEAEATGQPRPGRSKLARETGVSEHQVRKALQQLDNTAPVAQGDTVMSTSKTVTKKPRTTRRTTTKRQPQQAEAATKPGRGHKPWPLLVIGVAAAVAVWSGWVGLGQMAGFGIIHPLPGIWDSFKVNTAVVLPLSVEAYAAYALRVWLGTGTESRSPRAIRFARNSAIASLIIGAVAQVAYHMMSAAGYTQAPWPIVVLVAIVPVIVLGLASALAKLVTSNDTSEGTPT